MRAHAVIGKRIRERAGTIARHQHLPDGAEFAAFDVAEARYRRTGSVASAVEAGLAALEARIEEGR